MNRKDKDKYRAKVKKYKNLHISKICCIFAARLDKSKKDMKKLILMAVCMAFALHMSAQESIPQWLTELENQNKDFIDSILYYPIEKEAPNTRTYVLYYHQPLNHAHPDGTNFPLRALITVNTQMDPKTAVNHVYCSGYALDATFERAPDLTFKNSQNNCAAEIAHRYNANYISIEHRYFGSSAPSQCWTILDDLRAEEAAEDFHNLFVALKKVLKGKWVMSGVSKGGITTLLQHAFHPEDMDVFVPYSAPFFPSDRDTTMQSYWYLNGWDKEYQDLFMGIRRHGVYDENQKIYNIFYKMNCGGNFSQSHADSIWGGYLYNLTLFGFEEHAYSDTASIRKQLCKNTEIMTKYGFTEYCDTLYAYMFEKAIFSLDSFGRWIDTLRAYPDVHQAPRRESALRLSRDPFGVKENDWWNRENGVIKSNNAYPYQSKCELGYYDMRFDLIIEDKKSAAEWNTAFKKYVGCCRDFSNPCFASRTFDRSLYDKTMAATKNATKPIVLLYGEDDPWTGAAVKDEFINGSNVKKFILPNQNHGVHFTSNTDKTQCDAIRTILDDILGAPQDITQTPSDQVPSTKVLRNGQILVLRGDKTYTITGQEVR